MGIDFAVNECSNFDYVIKTDDDMYLNVNKIAQFLSELPETEQIYVGRCFSNAPPIRDRNSKWFISKRDYPNKTFPTFCTGAMYIMSMDIAKGVHM